MEAVIDQIPSAGMAGIEIAAVEIVNMVKVLLSQPHAGPVYSRQRGRPGGNPSSLPGEPPALQTGALRSGYDWRRLIGAVEIVNHVIHSAFLEMGTRKMRPRPHVRPAVEIVRGQIPTFVARAIEVGQRREAKRRGGRG